MTWCTMQAAQDHSHCELSTLYVSAYNVYIVKVVADEAAWGQVCEFDIALTTQEALTVVC